MFLINSISTLNKIYQTYFLLIGDFILLFIPNNYYSENLKQMCYPS